MPLQTSTALGSTSFHKIRHSGNPMATVSTLARNIVRVCSWCKKIHWNESIWLEPEEAAVLLRISSDSPKADSSHGICGDCKSALLAPIA